MALSLEDIDRELAARQGMGTSALSEVDAELKRRGVEPGPSNVASYNAGQAVTKVLQPIANYQGKIQSALPFVAGLAGGPMAGLEAAGSQGLLSGVEQLFQKGGEYAADHLPESMSDESRAGVGTGISMIPQIAGAFVPGPKFPEMRMLKPIAGAGREAGVQAAAEMGVPLTRAEITGAKSTSLAESALEKSLTGSGTIQKFRQAQSAAIENALQSIKKRFGSNEPLSSSGADAKIEMQGELGAARETGRKLYRDIPDVPIEPKNLTKALDDLVFNNPDKRVVEIANEVKGRLGPQPPITEETFQPSFGSTKRIFEENVPGKVENVPGEGNVVTPDSVKTFETKLQSEHRVGPVTPEAPAIPTFQKINDARNYLSKAIQDETRFDPIAGNQVTDRGRSLMPLKQALDADIQKYISGQKTPYGKMEAKQFGNAFTKANKFHGDVKDLINNKLVRKLSQAPASDVAKIVFSPGRPEDVLVAKSAMGQEGFSAIKKQYFNDLLESKNIGGELGKLEPEFLNVAFTPKELEALRKLDSVKKISLGAEKLAGNPSGTAQNIATGASIAALGHAAMKAFANPLMAAVEAAGILGIPYASAKAYIGTTKGIRLPVNAASQAASRGAVGLNSLGGNPDTRKTLMAILDRIKGTSQEAP